MTEKTFLSKRKWLNPKNHSDTGMYAVSVSADEYGVNGSFTLWDCSRKITLDFFCEEKDAKIRADKIDMLINGLQEMKEAMGKAYDYHLEAKEEEECQIFSTGN